MASSRAYNQNIATYISRHNTAKFDSIGKNMDKLVREKTKKRTMEMANILRFRENLGHGWGVFPISEKNGIHAHTGWKWSKTSDGYQIYNEHRNRNDDYPYVRNLVAGTGWSSRVVNGEHKRLVKNNGKLFSTQMPFGINPWILHQRQLLIQDIKLASGDKTIRGGKSR